MLLSVKCWLLLLVVDKALMAGVYYPSWLALLSFSPSACQQESPSMPLRSLRRQTQGKHIRGHAKSAEILPPCQPAPIHCTHTHSGIT